MRLLLSSDGRILSLWRGVLFYVVATWVVFPLVAPLEGRIDTALHLPNAFAPGVIISGEAWMFVVALICTGAFALYERRSVFSYGFALDKAHSSALLEGAALGVFLAGGVAVGMLLLGGMQVHGLAQTGAPLVRSTLMWLVANLCVGIAEEAFYRGYFLQAMWRTIGFWPAAIAVALVFAADHYFRKAGENLYDVVTLVSFSLIVSYSVRKTGALWLAVGFHFAFDFMQLFVIGSRNGGLTPVGRLLDVQFPGPAWVNGGSLGTEASVLMYPLLALVGLYLWRRYARTPEYRPE